MYARFVAPLQKKSYLYTRKHILSINNNPKDYDFFEKGLYDVALRLGVACDILGAASANFACASVGDLGRKGVCFG